MEIKMVNYAVFLTELEKKLEELHQELKNERDVYKQVSIQDRIWYLQDEIIPLYKKSIGDQLK